MPALPSVTEYILSEKFSVLASNSRPLGGEAVANYRLKLVEEILAEVAAIQSLIESGISEDRGMTRLSIARSVGLLIDLDRSRYRNPQHPRFAPSLEKDH